MLANLTSTQWTLSDEKLLVTFLHEHQAASGDGGNFKTATFQAAAVVLEAECTSGGLKTVKACQNKWASVGLLCFIWDQFSQFFCLVFYSNVTCFGPSKSSSATQDGIGVTKMV